MIAFANHGSATTQDAVLFSNEKVVVTKHFVEIGRGNYNIHEIKSVCVDQSDSKNFLYASAIVFLFIGWWGPHYMLLPPSLVLTMVAWRMPYKLVFQTDQGEKCVLKSRDHAELDRIKGAVEKAITGSASAMNAAAEFKFAVRRILR